MTLSKIPSCLKPLESGSVSRREWMGLLGSGVVAGVASSCTSPQQTTEEPASGLADPIYYSSATALCRAIRNKEISSEELVRVLVARIEEVNPKLNAVVRLEAERALRDARDADAALARGETRGPLHGLPMTLKDSIDTAGIVTTGGTEGRSEFIPERDATVAARLKAAGAVIVGKTNTPQLTLSYETNNKIFGRTSNPYDLSRSPGGSSGGAAAILATGGSPLEVGSDTGGSIRYPAHCCGLAGIKPTSGRVPRTGHIIPFGSITDSFTQLGPMARYVEDLTLALPILAGVDWRDPTIVPMPLGDPDAVRVKDLRVSFHTDNGIKTPDPEVADVVRQAAQALSDQGISVEEKRPTGIEQSHEIIQALWRADGGHFALRLLFEAGTRKVPVEAKDLKPTPMKDFVKVMDRWDSFRMDMISFLEDYDVILSPAFSTIAPPEGPPSDLPRYSYTQSYNLTGWPGAVVRGGTKDGLPIGIQIGARPWREDVALAVAKVLEEAMGGFQPPSL